MSANNHDNEDPNNVKYVRSKEKIKPTDFDEDLMNGRAIKIYTKANTVPLSEFIRWFKDNYSN